MRIPSQESFAALKLELSADERDVLVPLSEPDYHSEHAAFLVLTALRNGVAVPEIFAAPDNHLEDPDRFKALLSTVSPSTPESAIDSFFWSVPLSFEDEDRVYLSSAFLSHGESFSSLLVSFRGANSSNVPEQVPVSWFQRFFDGEQSLREEGIVLQADVSMVLFGYWGIDEVIDFLVRNVDLKEVTKLRAAGVEDLNEIADMTELLPSDWLDEFFGEE